jgi:hypothetical protein
MSCHLGEQGDGHKVYEMYSFWLQFKFGTQSSHAPPLTHTNPLTHLLGWFNAKI